MPLEMSNPPTVHKPGSYSHAVLVRDATRRLVISGQVGTAPDGRIAEGGEAQIDQALANLGAILDAHGMTPANLVKMTVFLTDPALIVPWRTKRGAWMGEHRSASTLLIVAGLADPRFLVEVEAEASD
ncbi:RidA family protein [Roseicella sp. DB1501]|uniref:RidA family protein n=1 Tax=Roseicella sp. DB1501 TaxID=2730925 RepID=UPI001C2CA5E2